MRRLIRLFKLAIRRPGVTAGEVDEEIRLHLELRAEALMSEGLPPERARAEALRRFGALGPARHTLHHAAQQRERTMQLRESLEALAQDLRYAFRGLRREPLFTGFVVATLALGIGANATMFGVVDRLLIRGPEHLTDPARLMRVYQRIRPRGGEEISHSF